MNDKSSRLLSSLPCAKAPVINSPAASGMSVSWMLICHHVVRVQVLHALLLGKMIPVQRMGGWAALLPHLILWQFWGSRVWLVVVCGCGWQTNIWEKQVIYLKSICSVSWANALWWQGGSDLIHISTWSHASCFCLWFPDSDCLWFVSLLSPDSVDNTHTLWLHVSFHSFIQTPALSTITRAC